MTVKDLNELYDYSCWANQELFRVLSQLPPNQFTQTVGGSYGSIRNTLVHMMSAEWGWLSRCGGSERGAALAPNDYPTCDSVKNTWKKIEIYVRHFLSRLEDDDLNRIVEFTLGSSQKRSMSIGDLLHHAIVHGVHHRGQVALMLRTLGYAPGNFDLLFYDAEKRAMTGQ